MIKFILRLEACYRVLFSKHVLVVYKNKEVGHVQINWEFETAILVKENKLDADSALNEAKNILNHVQ